MKLRSVHDKNSGSLLLFAWP